jgi:hypothetical protein
MKKITPRRPLDDDRPDGYLESDRDFVMNNIEAAVELLERELGDKTLTEKEKAKEVVDALTHYVNNMSHDPELLVDRITEKHRTLQQSIFNVFMMTIERWAQLLDKDRYDYRNEFTVTESKKIMGLYEGKWYKAPFI